MDLDGLYKLIMKDGLRDFRFRNSKVKPLGYSEENKGFILGFYSKGLLKLGKGFIMTSYEALLDNKHSLTHWTPNPYITLSYKDKDHSIVQGHEENKLRQINTFVIDIDDRKVNDSDILLACLDLGFLPTLIMQTPRGYQIYFVLTKPVYVTAKTDFKAVKIAKKISKHLRQALQQELVIDTKCNDFGVSRFPTEENVVYFDENNIYDFSSLITWSMKQETDNLTKSKVDLTLRKGSKLQINEPWFDLLLHKSNIKGEKGLMGRNNVALTLALAMFSSGKSKDTCLSNLYEFNARLQNPLKDSELNRTVSSAYSGKYQGANHDYIRELCFEWVNSNLQDKDLFESKGWFKFRKHRSERVRSHLSEWREDLLVYLKNNTSISKPKISLTRKEIMKALGIASSTLAKLLNILESDSLIQVKRFKGRYGGIQLSLIKNVIIHDFKANTAESREILAAYLSSLKTEAIAPLSSNEAQKQLSFLELDTG